AIERAVVPDGALRLVAGGGGAHLADEHAGVARVDRRRVAEGARGRDVGAGVGGRRAGFGVEAGVGRWWRLRRVAARRLAGPGDEAVLVGHALEGARAADADEVRRAV